MGPPQILNFDNHMGMLPYPKYGLAMPIQKYPTINPRESMVLILPPTYINPSWHAGTPVVPGAFGLLGLKL